MVHRLDSCVCLRADCLAGGDCTKGPVGGPCLGQRGKSRWSLRQRRSSRRRRRRTLTPRYPEDCRRRKRVRKPGMRTPPASAIERSVRGMGGGGVRSGLFARLVRENCDTRCHNCWPEGKPSRLDYQGDDSLATALGSGKAQFQHSGAAQRRIEKFGRLWHGRWVRRNGRRLCGDATYQG